MERKDSCSYLPQDDQRTGNFWLAKTFLISFLLRPVALLSLGRVRILFPSANCPSGEWKIFVLRGCVSTPEGQKIFTLLKDNWQKETKFVLSRGTKRPAALKERKMKKVFAIPQYPHPLVISCHIKSTFFPTTIQFFWMAVWNWLFGFALKKDWWYVGGEGPPLAVVAGVRLLLGHNAAGKHEKEKQGFWRLPREHLIESFKMSLLLIFWVDTWTCTSSPDPEAGRNMDLRCQPSHIKWGLISKLSMMLFSLHHPKPLWFFPAVLYGVFDDGFQVAREGNDWGCRLGVDIDHVLTGLLVFDCDFLVGLGVTEGGQVGDNFH